MRGKWGDGSSVEKIVVRTENGICTHFAHCLVFVFAFASTYKVEAIITLTLTTCKNGNLTSLIHIILLRSGQHNGIACTCPIYRMLLCTPTTSHYIDGGSLSLRLPAYWTNPNDTWLWGIRVGHSYINLPFDLTGSINYQRWSGSAIGSVVVVVVLYFWGVALGANEAGASCKFPDII